MADSFLPLYTGTTLSAQKMDTETLTVGANTVERERTQIAGSAATEVARVMATAPVGTEMGLVVRMASFGITSLVPGVGGTNMGKAVAATAGANDTGIAGLLVRTDALVTLTPADGQYTYGRTDSTGSQWVTLAHMAQAIGSTAHDTPDTQFPIKIGGRATAALFAAVTEGDRTDASYDLQGQLRTLTQGSVAHDGVDANNPLKVGGRASTTLRAAVADADRVDALWDADGALVVRRTAHANIVNGNASNTDGTSTPVIAAAGAGIRTYITDIALTNAHATTFGYAEIKDGTTVVQTIPVPPVGGAIVHFDPPLRGTANTAWNFDPSAAITTLYCSMHGYTSLT